MAEFEKIHKNFGFGFMRLPMQGDQVDIPQTTQMVDEFMAAGFNYFDTAHGYLDGKSEKALKECLTSRYPRESYVLTNKLTNFFFKTEEDIRPFFEQQLRDCGVDYFDFYLMHAQSQKVYRYFQKRNAYQVARQLKAEGKIRHLGISFHDRAEALEQILQENPDIEVVQIQFNYLDYADAAIDSRGLYEVCRKYGKPVIVMEPVRGGALVNLPEEGQSILDELHGGSAASYALRFAAGFEGIMMVLSGMSNEEQVADNVSVMKDFHPLTPAELRAVEKVAEVIRGKGLIACTGCRYCVAGCPQRIAIPSMFACRNQKKMFSSFHADYYYNHVAVLASDGHKASDCIGCGRCEAACPQHLPIRELLKEVAATFEKKKEA